MEESDRDFLKILWYKNGQPKASRFTRVPFGLSSSPYLLNVTLKKHLEQEHQKNQFSTEKVLKGLYVDDVIATAENEGEILKLRKELPEIFSKAGMNLHKWSSTLSPDFCKDSEFKWAQCMTKMLGLTWDPKADVFILDVTQLTETRRFWHIDPHQA